MTDAMLKPRISIVSTLYKSEQFLDEFIGKCSVTVESMGCTAYEIVIVNDGSPDNSLRKILEIKQRYPNIKVIDLSRNFGHHYALIAGMKYCSGDLIFITDCDLEVDPSILKTFYLELNQNSYDVVYGYQERRKGSLGEKLLGGLFWRMFNLLSETKIPENPTTERLMTRKYVDALLQLGDKNIFLAGMMYWSGFSQQGIPVIKSQRKTSSTYTINKRLSLLVEAISSFSAYPLKLLFKIGIFLTLVSFIYGCFLVIRKFLDPRMVLPGYTSLAVLILFSTGIIVTAIGIFGIYLEKMFNQMKNRPLFITKNIYE